MHGVLASLDLPTSSTLTKRILSSAATPMRTVSEHDFGLPICEAYCFVGPDVGKEARVYCCPLA